MTGFEIAGVLVFVLGYVFITFEHQINAQKAPTSLIMAGILWWIVSRAGRDFHQGLEAAGWEITQIVFFLMFAMALVEMISRVGFFDYVRFKLQERDWNNTKQFFVIAALTFFFSAILDNLTTAIVMVEIARRFFKGRNLLIAASGIVIMANAGGAWSPIGDVTTIMLWLAGKFTSGEIFANALLPASVHAVVGALLLGRMMQNVSQDDTLEYVRPVFTPQARILMTVSLLSFSLPFIATQFDLPPFVGLGFGFGVVGVLSTLIGHGLENHDSDIGERGEPMTSMQHDIQNVLKEVDYSSLIFFVGILLSVAALGALGILSDLSDSLFGPDPGFSRIAGGSVLLGWASAIVDNVPLTAMAIDTVPTTEPRLWSLLAYTVGTGGSHLIIGSAAGVVVMGRIRGLNSLTYMRIASIPVFFAFLAGVGVWVLQVALFG